MKRIMAWLVVASMIVPSLITLAAVGLSVPNVTASDIGAPQSESVPATVPSYDIDPLNGVHNVGPVVNSNPPVEFTTPDTARGEFWNFEDGEFSHYQYPVNYYDEGTNEYIPLNTTIIERNNDTFGDEYCFACNRNKYGIMFKNDASLGEYVSMQARVVLNDTVFKSPLKIDAMQAYYDNGTAQSYLAYATRDAVDVTGNSIDYDLYDGIDERYIVSADSLKHYYTVSMLPACNLTDDIYLVIPIYVAYNALDFELSNNGTDVIEGVSYDTISFVYKYTNESVYTVDEIRLVKDYIVNGIGYYEVDYVVGGVKIFAYVEFDQIQDVDEPFVIDPVWAVEYTSTGQLDDWVDLYNESVPVSYPDTRAYVTSRNWGYAEYYTESYVETNKTYNVNPGFYWKYDTMTYGRAHWNDVVNGESSGMWDDIYTQATNNITYNDGRAGDGVRYEGNDGMAYHRFDLSDARQYTRNLDMYMDVSVNTNDYTDGASVGGTYRVSTDLTQVDFRNWEWGYYPTYTYLPYIEFQWLKEYPPATGSYCRVTDGTTTYDLNFNEFYTMRIYNMSFEQRFDEWTIGGWTKGGYRYVNYTVEIYNTTTSIGNFTISFDAGVWTPPYVYGVWGFDIYSTFNNGGNASRTSWITIDNFKTVKHDLFYVGDTWSSRNVEYTIDLCADSLPYFFKHDVFVAYFMWDGTVSGDVRYVQAQYWTGSAWALIPDWKMPGNSAGYTPIIVSTDYNTYYGISVLDFRNLDMREYGKIRMKFAWHNSQYTGSTTLLSWTHWYIKGVEAAYTAYSSLDTQSVKNIWPVEYNDGSSANYTMEFNLLDSLFGDTEAIAGSRIYYSNATSMPGYDDPSWTQIDANLYSYDEVSDTWILYQGDYDFVPTKMFRQSPGGVVNENAFLWYPDYSLPEGQYWFKIYTLNMGMTIANIIVSDWSTANILNRAPEIATSANITMLGAEMRMYNTITEGTTDDGGVWNILNYIYYLHSDDYSYEEYVDTTDPNFEIRLPDDGNYTLEVYVFDSKGMGNSTIVYLTDLNHAPYLVVETGVYATIFAEATVSDKFAEIGQYNAAIGDLVTFDMSQSYDEDGTIISYVVDYGDGESTEYTPSYQHQSIIADHVYLASGDYTVTISATDDDLNTTIETFQYRISSEVDTEYTGVHTNVGVSSDGVPVTFAVNVLNEPSKYEWVAKYIWKESLSVIIEKNELFTDEIDARQTDNASFGVYAKDVTLTLELDYFNKSLDWKADRTYWTDVLIYEVDKTGNVRLMSVDATPDIDSMTVDATKKITISSGDNFDSIVIVTNPSIWLRLKTWVGSRTITSLTDITTATEAAVRVPEEDVYPF